MGKPISEYSEFQRYIDSKYNTPEIDKADYLFIIYAPEQYEIEDDMLAYVKKNPNAEMGELLSFFDSIAPDGLPPCASEWDDEEDE